MRDRFRIRISFFFWIVLVTLLGFCLIYFPLVILVVGSFLPEGFSGPWEVRGWTFSWYAKLFENPSILEALELSLLVAFWSTLGSTLLGTLGALALSWGQFPGKKAFRVLSFLPLVLPEIVIGLALLIWFVVLNATLGVFSMVIAHITFSTSYVLVTVKSRLDSFDPSLLEAARDLGANPRQIFFRVILPLITPAMMAGALMAFTLSFDDFLISYFISGAGMETLPVKIYSMVKFGITPEMNALSTVLVGVTAGVVSLISGPFDKAWRSLHAENPKSSRGNRGIVSRG